MKAEQIYEVMTSQRFYDFYHGMFTEHLENAVKNPPTKQAVLNRITTLFKLDEKTPVTVVDQYLLVNSEGKYWDGKDWRTDKVHGHKYDANYVAKVPIPGGGTWEKTDPLVIKPCSYCGKPLNDGACYMNPFSDYHV